MEKVILDRKLRLLLKRIYPNLVSVPVCMFSGATSTRSAIMDGENYRYNHYYSFYTDDTLQTKIGETQYFLEYLANPDAISVSFEFQQRARRLQKSRAKEMKKIVHWFQMDKLVIFKT